MCIRDRSLRIFGIPTVIMENVGGVSSERSVEVVGRGLMNSPVNTWQRNPIASMSRFKSFFRFRISLTFKFIIAVFLFFYVYSFLCGFFGFFDENTIGEFKKAAKMVKKPISKLSYPLYKFAEWGCRASPGLHNRYPLDIFTAAMEEAKELEREKVKLKM